MTLFSTLQITQKWPTKLMQLKKPSQPLWEMAPTKGRSVMLGLLQPSPKTWILVRRQLSNSTWQTEQRAERGHLWCSYVFLQHFQHKLSESLSRAWRTKWESTPQGLPILSSGLDTCLKNKDLFKDSPTKAGTKTAFVSLEQCLGIRWQLLS